MVQKKRARRKPAPAAEPDQAEAAPLKLVGTRFTETQFVRMKHFCVDERTTMRDMFRDAIADYMKRKGYELGE